MDPNDFTPKNADKFDCKNCDFKCCKESDYIRHINTPKHINRNKGKRIPFWAS